MLVLSARLREKVHFPDLDTSVEVVSINAGAVKLGIEAPDTIRVLREGLPDRIAEWGREDIDPPRRVEDLVHNRLEVARRGLSEARRHLRAGREEEAAIILEKLDEDLHLLRRRLQVRELAGLEQMADT